MSITMPANSSLSFSFGPPESLIYVVGAMLIAPARDPAGNPVQSSLFTCQTSHEQLRAATAHAYESNFMESSPVYWLLEHPTALKFDAANGLGFAVTYTITFQLQVYNERFSEEIHRMWQGIRNIFYMYGGYNVETLVEKGLSRKLAEHLIGGR